MVERERESKGHHQAAPYIAVYRLFARAAKLPWGSMADSQDSSSASMLLPAKDLESRQPAVRNPSHKYHKTFPTWRFHLLYPTGALLTGQDSCLTLLVRLPSLL
ncbi:hypothetical protein WJX74_002234 [Apatococcus lobatus]|uniref:Uncharacterized protein n=2 Tax=Apatococcus TaxID=904362 RepID=A0AAW1TAD5_9CHLO